MTLLLILRKQCAIVGLEVSLEDLKLFVDNYTCDLTTNALQNLPRIQQTLDEVASDEEEKTPTDATSLEDKDVISMSNNKQVSA